MDTPQTPPAANETKISRNGAVMYRDPRGPERRIVSVVKPTFDVPRVKVTLDCGHVPDLVSHFSYRVDDPCRCFACGQDEAAAVKAEGR